MHQLIRRIPFIATLRDSAGGVLHSLKAPCSPLPLPELLVSVSVCCCPHPCAPFSPVVLQPTWQPAGLSFHLRPCHRPYHAVPALLNCLTQLCDRI